MICYRNKLIVAFKDHLGWIRYARLDSTDPDMPWIPLYGEIIAGRSTSARPALTTFTSANLSAGNRFGYDIFAAVKGRSNNKTYFINFSRIIFKQYLKSIGLGVGYFLDESALSATTYNNRLYVFLRDRQNKIQFTNSIDGENWDSNWINLGGEVTRRAAPAPIVFKGKLFVFITRHSDISGRQVWKKTGNNVGNNAITWSNWEEITHLPEKIGISDNGPVAAIFKDKLYIFVHTNGGIYAISSFDSKNWSNWEALPNPPKPWRYSCSGSSAGVCSFNNQLVLFARMLRVKDGAYHAEIFEIASNSYGSWAGSGWKSLNFESPSDPVVREFKGKLYIFARNKWNGLSQNIKSTKWTGWVSMPGSDGLTASGPGISIFNNKLFLFARTLKYGLKNTVTSDGKNWTGWSNLSVNASSLYGPFEPKVENLPVYSEIGYACWLLPHWMMNHIFKDKMKHTSTEVKTENVYSHHSNYGIHVSSKYLEFSKTNHYPFWINFSTHAWIGGGITSNYSYNFEYPWHEMAHAILGAMGIGVGHNAVNLEPGIQDAALKELKKLFGRPMPQEKQGKRPLGFAGWYSEGIQHDFMDVLIHYFNKGNQLRNMIVYDQQYGKNVEQKTLLKLKYNWIKKHIFHGLEFGSNSELLL
jgi:hypothetical protein